MRFYLVERTGALPRSAEFPCVRVEHDSWDDFGYKTLRRLTYFAASDTAKAIGEVKILQLNSPRTTLAQSFDALGSEYCSLGQSVDYYRLLANLGQDVARSILLPLNDIVLSPDLAGGFSRDHGFESSLLRFSGARNAYDVAGMYLGLSARRQLSVIKEVNFETTVPGAIAPHRLELKFSSGSDGLRRMAAIIGPNGTGKTQVLARFANAMSGLRGDGVFEPDRPEFSHVIAVSYSVFDEFDRPDSTQSFSYTYCGLRPDRSIQSYVAPFEIEQSILEENDELLTSGQLRSKLNAALRRMTALGRRDQWILAVEELFEGRVTAATLWDGETLANDRYRTLSSGQRMLLLVISEIIAWMEFDSIVLFDEPEAYLHPNALSALARSLRFLLVQYQSYAILATHSPIVLQEIPARMVRVFARDGDVPGVFPLPIECFGESLSAITDHVFGVSPSEQNYRASLRSLAENSSFDQIVGLFGEPGLGLNARAFLKSLENPADSR